MDKADLKWGEEVEIEPISLDERDKHFGLKKGKHYRISDGLGCIHIRVHEGRYYAHIDLVDPRVSQAGHLLEIIALAIKGIK